MSYCNQSAPYVGAGRLSGKGACVRLAVVLASFALPGCTELRGAFTPTPGVDAIAATPDAGGAKGSPERAAAVAEMRRRAAADDAEAYPGVFEAEQAERLAARSEPRSVSDAASIEAELTAISETRRAGLSPAEAAALDARAKELRRLAAWRQAPELRR